MNTNLIRERLHESTKPFVLRLSDGSRVPVLHPDFIAVSPGLVIVVNADDTSKKIDPLHIVAIDEVPQARRNGKRAH